MKHRTAKKIAWITERIAHWNENLPHWRELISDESLELDHFLPTCPMVEHKIALLEGEHKRGRVPQDIFEDLRKQLETLLRQARKIDDAIFEREVEGTQTNPTT